MRETITNLFPPAAQKLLNAGGWEAGLIVLGLIGLYVVYSLLGRFLSRLFRKRGPVDESSMVEQLGQYGPPALPPESARLTVEGIPVRLRLVVVAPVGKDQAVGPHVFGPVLEGLCRGLGGVVTEDRPKMRVWPAQLSREGFAATFHRLVKKPQADGKPSPWVLVAGTTSPGKKTFMVGLALEADSANSLGRLSPRPGEWPTILKVRQG